MVEVLGEGWPRDFQREDQSGGRMFLGTALHWINKAAHSRDRDADDILQSSDFVERPDRDNPEKEESFESQRWGYRRGEVCRAIMLDWLRRGRVDAFWLDEDGNFHPVRKRAWGWNPRSARTMAISRRHNICAAITDAGLRRFGLAPAYFERSGKGPVPAGRRFIYVRPDQVLAQLVRINPLASRGFPSQPEKTLPGFAEAPLADVQRLPLLAALTWIATRDMDATAGAISSPVFYGKRFADNVAFAAAHTLVSEQVGQFYCACRKPVCGCWAGALDQLKAVAGSRSPSITAWGHRNDQGDEEEIPAAAWQGAPSYDATCWLEPSRPNGTRWGNVFFYTDDILAAFPVGPAANPSPPPQQTGGWKEWAKGAVDRNIGIKAAHDDARTHLGDAAPGQTQARNLIRTEIGRRGQIVRHGRPTSGKN